MNNKRLAEILFLNPNDLDAARPKLAELGFEVEVLTGWVDPHGPTKWILARALSELEPSDWFNWVSGVVEPLGGDVVEAGFEHPDDRQRYGDSTA
jgi:hypothetical protein